MASATIQSKTLSLVKIDELKLNPKNPNTHSIEQVKRLAEIIRYQGFRNPIVVSNRSGFVAAGHGRIEAAKMLSMVEVPVSFQDFETEEQEYAYMVSDNSIAEWADLDLDSIRTEVGEWELDLDLLGFKNFELDSEFKEPPEKKEPEEKTAELLECPNCGVQISNG